MAKETKSLYEIIKDAIDKRLLDVHISLPARIESYDRSQRKAKIKPLLKRKYKDGTVVEIPVIPNVPVIMPSSDNGNVLIDLPIKVGDVGTVLFCERSLDLWLVQGGLVEPVDTRKFNLSDAQFFPGLNPFNANLPTPSNSNDLRIKNNKLVFDISPDGKIKLDNESNELISVLVELLSTLVSAKVITGIGSQPFIASTVSSLNSIKTKLESFKV